MVANLLPTCNTLVKPHYALSDTRWSGSGVWHRDLETVAASSPPSMLRQQTCANCRPTNHAGDDHCTAGVEEVPAESTTRQGIDSANTASKPAVW